VPWEETKNRIRSEIQREHRGILKCKGSERRSIVSNNGQEIVVKTGDGKRSKKSITYEMIKYAYERIASGEIFDSAYFRKEYSQEYKAGPCRYSTIGGILVEIGEAERIPFGARSCIYRRMR
jgi:hypothetical protein